MGKSIAGLAAGLLVGGIASIVWLLVMIFAQSEIGILAWGIGALIGLVAGVIAKNPSPIFCGLTSVIAVGSIFSAKLIMAALLMVMVIGSNMIEELGGMFAGDKYSHAYVDQAMADGQLQGAEVALANDFNKWYFRTSDDFGDDGDEAMDETADEDFQEPETDLKASREFFKKVRKAVKEATPEEKERWLAGARQRHPLWIEDDNHRIAALIELKSTPGKLSPDLTAHAEFEIDGRIDLMGGTEIFKKREAYQNNLTPIESQKRSKALRTMCADLLRGKSTQELDQLLNQAVEKYPLYTPDRFAFVAVVDKMMTERTLDPALVQHAKMFLDAEFTEGDSMAYGKMVGKPGFQESEFSLHKAVNPEVTKLGPEGRKLAIQETKKRHSNWYGGEGIEEIVLDEKTKKDMGDGSFAGSLKQVLSPLDFLWIFLGAFSAYGAAYARAKQE
jgi:curved DNA-binding protein CbpA